MELAKLAIAIDSRQTMTAKQWLDHLTDSGERAEKAMDGVGAGGRAASSGNSAAAASARNATSALNQQEAAARRLTATIRQYASIVFGAFSAREIIRMADDWGQYASRLRIATEQSGDFIQVQQRMLDISNRVYKSFGDSAEMYIRTAKALQELGYSSKQAGDLVETLQYSLTVSAADGQKAGSVIDALSKSILIGKVAMQEYNTVVAYNPRLQQAMADAITGGSLAALQKMVAEGKLTVDQLMKVTSEMDRMGREADQMPVTMEDAVQRMNNKLTAFFGKVNESTGAVNVMTDAVDAMGDAFDRIDISAIARDFAVLSDTWGLISERAVEAWEAVDDFGKRFQTMLGASEDGVRSLGDSIVTSFEQSFLNTAKELDALHDAIFGTLASLTAGFRTLGENIWTAMKWGFDKTLAEFSEMSVAIADWLNSTFNTNRFTFTIRDQPGDLVFKSLREEADKAREAVEGSLGAYNALANRIGDNGLWRAAVVAMDAYSSATAKTTGATAKLAQEQDKGKKVLTEAQKAAQAFTRERQQALRSQYAAISAIHDEAQALEDQVLLFGLGKTALEDLTIARLEEQAAVLRGFDGSEEQVAVIEREIDARRRLREAMGSLEHREAEQAAWDSWARDMEQVFQQVGQSFTDYLFDSGRSARDMIRDLFKNLTLRVLVQPVMSGLQGMLTGMGPAGVATAGSAGAGLMNNAGGLFSMFGGNSMGMGISNVMSSLSTSSMLSGTGVGNWLMGASGNVAGMSNLALGGAGLLGGIGAGLLFGNKGYSSMGGGLGATAGMALGGPVGAVVGSLAGGALGSLFGDDLPTTRRSQQGATGMLPDGSFVITSHDSRQEAAAQEAARAIAEQSVRAANELFAQAGVDAAIWSFQTLMESSILGDKHGVGSSGQVRVGDRIIDIGIPVEPSWTRHGVGGWSEADMLPRLATDIQLTILEAFQQADIMSSILGGVNIRGLDAATAQQLTETVQAVIQEVSAFQASMELLPFANLRDLSFDAAQGLLHLTGGLENLAGAQQTYLQNFYTDAERHELAISNLTHQFGEVGLELPAVTDSAEEMRLAYRGLVDAQDLSTEAGRRAYAVLMGAAGAFAEVANYASQAEGSVDSLGRSFDSLLSSFMGMASDALSAVQQRGQERIAKLSESFANTDSILGAYRSQVQQMESQWGSLITTMGRSMRDLRGQVEASSRLQYDQARAVISTALLTGQLPQTADLNEVIRTAQQGVTGGRYASAFDQRAAMLTLANELEALQAIAQPELDIARASLEQMEKQYNRLRGIEDFSGLSLKAQEHQLISALAAEESARVQIAGIERQISMAQLQYQQLVGINEELSALPGALNALAKAIGAASAVREAAGQGASSGVSREAQYLANNPDVLQAYLVDSYGLAADEFARMHYERHGKREGRSFDVGTSYVPYDMMANIHRGEIIIDPRSSDILRRYGIGVQGGGGNNAALERKLDALLEHFRRKERQEYEDTKNLKRIALNTEDAAMAVAHGESEGAVVIY